MILIYTHHKTPRIIYAIDLVFNHVLNLTYELTDNEEYFEKHQNPKLAYTTKSMQSGLFIQSTDVMFKSTIEPVALDFNEHFSNYPKFFLSHTNDFLGYDLFAMVFYFASRFEEYMPSKLDEHQRFQAEKSIAFQFNFLNIPFLNIAINEFGEKLKHEFPEIQYKQRAFNFLSTIDIDNAFAYAHKGLKRNIGGLLKDVYYLKFRYLIKRIQSNLNDINDPYNTFDLIDAIHQETKIPLQYFVLIGDYGSYDKNPNYKNSGFKKLLKSLSLNYTVGLHPSYNSYNSIEYIEKEKQRLEDILEKKITSARCHFLKLKLPQTYRAFIEFGITDDYTMIYPSQSGFRTGLCTPYPWFDLQKNERTNLILHPSIIMEGTLRDYMHLTPEYANLEISMLLNKVKQVGGEFISVWHNDSFVKSQKDWINVYKQLLIQSKK